MSFQKNHRVILAAHFSAKPAGAGRDDTQRAKQPAQNVEMVNQHFTDQQALELREKRLPHELRQDAHFVCKQPRRAHLHDRRHRRTQLSVIKPALDVPVVRAKTPVLVHHQTDFAVDRARQAFRFSKTRGQRLLAKYVNAFGCGKKAQRNVCVHRCRNVDRVGPHLVEHLRRRRRTPRRRRTGEHVLQLSPHSGRTGQRLRRLARASSPQDAVRLRIPRPPSQCAAWVSSFGCLRTHGSARLSAIKPLHVGEQCAHLRLQRVACAGGYMRCQYDVFQA